VPARATAGGHGRDHEYDRPNPLHSNKTTHPASGLGDGTAKTEFVRPDTAIQWASVALRARISSVDSEIALVFSGPVRTNTHRPRDSE
jgi:hypothetical protein